MGKPTLKKPGKVTKKKKTYKDTLSKLLAPGLRQQFMSHYLTSNPVWFLTKNMKIPQRIRPGAVLPVDPNEIALFGTSYQDDDLYEALGLSLQQEKLKKLDKLTWLPLDSDLVEGILQHLVWDRDSRFNVEKDVKSGIYNSIKYQQTIQIQEKCANALDQLYMEAVWRQINKKK